MMKKWLIGGIIFLLAAFGIVFGVDRYETKSLLKHSIITTPVTQHILSAKDISIPDLFKLTNNARVKAALPPLVEDPRLDASAKAKCDDMVTRDYFAHDTPDGKTPWIFFTAKGITYKKAGENLAYGQHHANKVVTDWMNSPEHKANILDPKYTDVGYAVCYSPEFINDGIMDITVQHFAQY